MVDYFQSTSRRKCIKYGIVDHRQRYGRVVVAIVAEPGRYIVAAESRTRQYLVANAREICVALLDKIIITIYLYY